MQLARAYFGLDNPTWAATQLEEALRLLTANDGQGNPAEAADALMLAGSIVTRIKKMKEALQFYEAASKLLCASRRLSKICIDAHHSRQLYG